MYVYSIVRLKLIRQGDLKPSSSCCLSDFKFLGPQTPNLNGCVFSDFFCWKIPTLFAPLKQKVFRWVQGMYHVSCNIRLDGGSGSYFRTIIAVDGVAHIQDGLHSIRGSPPSSYFTMVVDGNAYLRVGQRVSVYIVAADQSIRYYIQSESGFSAYYIGRGGDTLHLG